MPNLVVRKSQSQLPRGASRLKGIVPEICFRRATRPTQRNSRPIWTIHETYSEDLQSTILRRPHLHSQYPTPPAASTTRRRRRQMALKRFISNINSIGIPKVP